MNKKTTGVYAGFEMKYMTLFHKFKGIIFLPIIKILNKLGITANMITIFGGIVVLIFFFLTYYFNNPFYFVVGIWLHMFLDSIDGVMARYNNSMSDYGSLLDVIFDHLGIFFTSIFLILYLDINSILVFSYTIFYTMIIYNSFILGKIKDPYKIVLRPRLFIYFSIIIDLIYNFEITFYLLIIFSTILLTQSIQGLLKLLNYFSKK